MEIKQWIVLISLFFTSFSCHSDIKPDDPPVEEFPVEVWVTSGNELNLLYKKSIDFIDGKDDRFPVIAIDTSDVFQQIDGFGFTLTGGSAQLIHQMEESTRISLLNELFSSDESNIGISYLRLSIGASDLDPVVFSYNDLPEGQSDPDLENFSLSRDTLHLIPVLKEILSINPDIKLLGSPWSPPTWMKSNGSSIGGRLLKEYYPVYAAYFVRYLQAMEEENIFLDAITVQNEPHHGGNNPSMVMTADEQTEFVRDHLGPAFESAGLNTKIIIWDHNCDEPEYPITVLDDPIARNFIDGSAFHLYSGDISALSAVHEAHPDKNLYFTEQWTGSNGEFKEELMWHVKNVIIGTTRNWGKVALEWNLASDPEYKPHTPGGCTQCKGALTIDGSVYTRNVSYYIIAHASKFILPGSIRIQSDNPGNLHNVSFIRPDGKKVLLVVNESQDLKTFNVYDGNKWFTATLQAFSVGTFIW